MRRIEPRAIVASAEIMWSARAVTLREVELWGQIVGPHYNQPGMMAAVVEWQHAMVAEGLSDTAPESLAAFMRGEPVDASTVRS